MREYGMKRDLARRRRVPRSTPVRERTVQESCLEMLTPFAAILLRAGISAGEFTELCRRAYVQVAVDQLTPLGRKPNASRIAVATGLTRQEVARLLRPTVRSASRGQRQAHRANRVLRGWYMDPRYSSPIGEPRPITIRGTGFTFHTLVRKYGGDVPPRAVLDELRRAAAIRTLSNGLILPTRRSVKYGDRPELALRHTSQKLSLLAETLRHNLDYPGATLFEGIVLNPRLRADHCPILNATRSYLEREERQHATSRASGTPHALGLGIFLFGKAPTHP